MNTKFIKIIIVILIVIVIIFGFVFIQKNKTQNTTIDTNNQSSTTDSRVIFNTQTTLDKNNSNYSTSSDLSQPLDQKTNVVEYKEGFEELQYDKTSKILFNWNITKDPEILKEALKTTTGADNEALLETWRPFMAKNSADLIKLIDSSTNIKQTKTDIRLIFEWYIELSGDYEKLSSTKRQELMRQYQLLK